jgi:hypothetical protein
MSELRVTRSAKEQIGALDAADARAVDAALASLDDREGRPINLPGAPVGTSFLAMPTQVRRDGPVIIYRPLLPTEKVMGWLVVSVLSGEDFRNITRAEEYVAEWPAARAFVDGVVAGTVPTARAHGPAGAARSASDGGAAPTPDPGSNA